MSEPTFQYVVIVDIEGFGSRANPVQQSLSAAMYETVRTAFADVGVDPEAVSWNDRGDGIILMVPTTATTSVVLAGRFVSALDDALREKARFHSAEHRMRFRVALHRGDCHRTGDGWIGEAINTTARLVDAAPLKAALKAAPEAAMAFIVSDEIYQGVVRHGYRGMDPTEFAPVDLQIKELHGRAWIQVPGRSYPPGIEPAAPAPAPASTPTPASASVPAAPASITVGGANHGTIIGHIDGGAVFGNTFSGDR